LLIRKPNHLFAVTVESHRPASAAMADFAESAESDHQAHPLTAVLANGRQVQAGDLRGAHVLGRHADALAVPSAVPDSLERSAE
jgi:hypothetical protein